MQSTPFRTNKFIIDQERNKKEKKRKENTNLMI